MTKDELLQLIEEKGVHDLLGPVGEGWGIEQNPVELAFFLHRMIALEVTSMLEIGTGYRGGFSRFCSLVLGWDVTTVDIRDYHHSFYGIEYIVLDGEHPFYPQAQYDLVFIDGAHDYESVEKDYQWYHAFADKAVAFHDIGGKRDCDGARLYWEKIKRGWCSHRAQDILVISDQGAGIGWLELPCTK